MECKLVRCAFRTRVFSAKHETLYDSVKRASFQHHTIFDSIEQEEMRD